MVIGWLRRLFRGSEKKPQLHHGVIHKKSDPVNPDLAPRLQHSHSTHHLRHQHSMHHAHSHQHHAKQDAHWKKLKKDFDAMLQKAKETREKYG